VPGRILTPIDDIHEIQMLKNNAEITEKIQDYN
jgi:hypothetical protein